MIDTILTGANIYDGTGAAPIVADLAIVGERIALLGSLGERDAHRRIDVSGLALAPGFIDVHSHSDELWLADGRCESKVRQGVTTEIGGNCGTSIAPLRGLAEIRKAEDTRDVGVELSWKNLDEFFGIVERAGVALNVATLAGLGTIRRCVVGDRPDRLEPNELAAVCALVRETCEAGALGVSSGLIYVPSRYADRAELAACAIAAREGGAPLYASHIRNEADDLLAAVDEALDVGFDADVAVQLSHHKAAGKKNWGKVHRSLDAIANARARGLNAGSDVYPYVAMWTDLSTILPEDALAGGRDATLERLRDPETATALALRLALERTGEWHDIAISTVRNERLAWTAGMRVDEIAAHWHLSAPRAALRLLLEDELATQAIFFAMSEDDIATILSADFVSIGSDASSRSTSGPTAQGMPHPRTFGTFPRIFGRFVRGRRTLALGEAIRRMTSLPAQQFSLKDRGRIAVGAYADLVAFDPETIVDTATYDAPFQFPIGISYVWVNGQAVVAGGEQTRAKPGRVLRSGR